MQYFKIKFWNQDWLCIYSLATQSLNVISCTYSQKQEIVHKHGFSIFPTHSMIFLSFVIDFFSSKEIYWYFFFWRLNKKCSFMFHCWLFHPMVCSKEHCVMKSYCPMSVFTCFWESPNQSQGGIIEEENVIDLKQTFPSISLLLSGYSPAQPFMYFLHHKFSMWNKIILAYWCHFWNKQQQILHKKEFCTSSCYQVLLQKEDRKKK